MAMPLAGEMFVVVLLARSSLIRVVNVNVNVSSFVGKVVKGVS